MRDSSNPAGTEIVVEDLEIPWAMDFSPDKRLFFTEREGRVKVLDDNNISTLLEIRVEAKRNDEGGLLGLTLSPNFTSDNYIYIYYTYSEQSNVMNRVSRFTLLHSELIDEKIIIDKIPGGRVHNGGRIKFGPDGKLYVTTGEIWQRRLAQDLSSLGGKILRLNPDGSIPPDNPWRESPIFSYGNRNSQGIDWHPITGTLFASEHGPSGENNWRAHDEINIIKPGKNYGWPEVIGSPDHPDFENPLINTGDETWAPSGICFYSGNRFIEWKNALLVANLRGRHLRVIKLDGSDYEKVLSSKPVYNGELGRLRDVIMGPDEFIYLCTSNRDGRGDPMKEDDMIIRITNPPV
jgi:aldose sugar dehydrogenase